MRGEPELRNSLYTTRNSSFKEHYNKAIAYRFLPIFYQYSFLPPFCIQLIPIEYSRKDSPVLRRQENATEMNWQRRQTKHSCTQSCWLNMASVKAEPILEAVHYPRTINDSSEWWRQRVVQWGPASGGATKERSALLTRPSSQEEPHLRREMAHYPIPVHYSWGLRSRL